MNPNTQLLFGIVMVGMGILLAVAAYFVLTNRRPAQEAQPGEDEAEAALPARAEAGLDVSEPVEAIPAPPAALDEQVPESPEIAQVPLQTAPPQEGEPGEEAEPVEERPLAPAGPSDLPTAEPMKIEIATLMRDEVTGALIIRVGDREYRNAGELKESRDWTRLEFASGDLARWFSRPSAAQARPELEVGDGMPKPTSMIEQINAILQQKIAETSGEQKAIRLIEGPGGSVRVLLGVRSFNLDEVPNPEARELIRQAVAAWEDLQ
jgi:type IV secretory pathway VirB10-like protein